MERKPEVTPLSDAGAGAREKKLQRREALEKIRKLQAKSVRGLWAVSAFLLVSIWALNDFRFIPSMPENVRGMLGSPPPPNLVSGLLVLYSFSAIILILSRMMSGAEPSRGLLHVIYLTLFYGFYHLAGSLEEYFWAVFVSGFTILALENFHNLVRYKPLIREEQEKLRKLDNDEFRSNDN
jgi:hypothetical protein